jgi:hypothetical protein
LRTNRYYEAADTFFKAGDSLRAAICKIKLAKSQDAIEQSTKHAVLNVNAPAFVPSNYKRKKNQAYVPVNKANIHKTKAIDIFCEAKELLKAHASTYTSFDVGILPYIQPLIFFNTIRYDFSSQEKGYTCTS